jgi:hypothetical protein
MERDAVVRKFKALLGPQSERLSGMFLVCADAQLRPFACACAHYALQSLDLRDPALERGLLVGEAMALADSSSVDVLEARQAVEQRVNQLDEASFDAQDAVEAGTAPSSAYDHAFSLARAATSVLRCLAPTALDAAFHACYEAYHATYDMENLTRIGTAILTRHA